MEIVFPSSGIKINDHCSVKSSLARRIASRNARNRFSRRATALGMGIIPKNPELIGHLVMETLVRII